MQRNARRSEFKASLVGYTNAGKSSILRELAGADEVFVEDRLFATLDPLTREVDLGENARALLTDTVGFIRKLPHHLVASFRATLEEAREADLLLHVIDASHGSWDEQRAVVDGVLRELELQEQPQLLVFNKLDLLDENGAARAPGAHRVGGRRSGFRLDRAGARHRSVEARPAGSRAHPQAAGRDPPLALGRQAAVGDSRVR